MMAETNIEPTLASLSERLRVLHRQTRETPLFNPVFQLSLDISRKLESGDLGIADLGGLVDELEAQSLDARANRLRNLLAPADAGERLASLASSGAAFDSYRAFWEQPHMHVVFTAHPTFLLAPQQSEAVAQAVANGGDARPGAAGEAPEITLRYEHQCAMAALANAQDARDRMVSAVLDRAQAEFPGRWCELQPLPFRFASWVGYDMDGRTDIKWYTCRKRRSGSNAMPPRSRRSTKRIRLSPVCAEPLNMLPPVPTNLPAICPIPPIFRQRPTG